MKLVKCVKNPYHFYDAEKYAVCPHCEAASGQGDAREFVQGRSSAEQSEWKNASGRRTHSENLSNVTVLERRNNRSVSGQNDDKSNITQIQQKHNSVWNMSGSSSLNATSEKEEPNHTSESQLSGENLSDSVVIIAEDAISKVSENSLAASVIKAKEMDTEEVKTVALYDFGEQEPVVGWLVCVSGVYKGESFNLKSGRNLIGRSGKMDVVLAKDLSVSRDKHAALFYDFRKRKFHIAQGDGNGIIYVNDDMLMETKEIHDYDMIELGRGKFLFRSMCGDCFTWDDYVD